MHENTIFWTLVYVTAVAYSYVVFIRLGAIPGDRNDPTVIKSRIIRVLLCTSLNVLIAPYILIDYLEIVPNISSFYEVTGLTNLFRIENIVAVFKTLLLFMILFAGPLFEEINSFQCSCSSKIEVLRDLFIAPLTEEFIYTSLTTGSLLAYELSTHSNIITYSPTQFHNDKHISKYIQLSPLFFGFAHVHHGVELRNNGVSFVKVITVCGFQCAYTTLFGYLTNRVFVNTGSLWCCFIAHSFCNFMGFPSLTTNGSFFHNTFYFALLIGGIYGFGLFFDKLTFNPMV
jgi:prenyl protein peptidase